MENENKMSTDEIKIAMEKIRIYTKKQLLDCKMRLAENVLTLEFDDGEPASAIIEQIKELVFFTNEVVFSNINSVFSCSGKKITIDFSHYSLFVRLYEQLKDFKCNIFAAEIEKSTLEFHYTLKHKHDLNANELDILQNIVNPDICNHDSIRVSYMTGVATLWAKLDKG